MEQRNYNNAFWYEYCAVLPNGEIKYYSGYEERVTMPKQLIKDVRYWQTLSKWFPKFFADKFWMRVDRCKYLGEKVVSGWESVFYFPASKLGKPA